MADPPGGDASFIDLHCDVSPRAPDLFALPRLLLDSYYVPPQTRRGGERNVPEVVHLRRLHRHLSFTES